jgi:probable HAF family extracellular repeat protein
MLKPMRILGLLAMFAATAAAQQYTVSDLGTFPGGNSSVAYKVNNAGQVAGNSNLPGNAYGHAFIFQNGGLTDLGTLTGTWSVAFQVNASGQAAGYAPLADGSDRAFIFSNGQMTALPTLGGGFSDGYAINDAGQVAGASGTSDGDTHPFLFSNGQMIDLGTLGSHGSMFWNTGLGVNNLGEVVGYSYDANGNFFGFLWSNGKMHKIGTLGGLWSEAWAINDSSQVTGSAYTKGDLGTHAFLFSKGKIIDIDGRGATSSSIGWAINNHGVVVGRFDVPNGYRAFISTGKLQDLNTMIPANSGWILEEARGINDAGQISGYGFHNGKERGFLLTPVK